jgi:hypothetical protein
VEVVVERGSVDMRRVVSEFGFILAGEPHAKHPVETTTSLGAE